MWVELAAAVAGPGAGASLEGFDADDALVLRRVSELVATVEARQAEAEAMVAALEPALCEALKELLAEQDEVVGGPAGSNFESDASAPLHGAAPSARLPGFRARPPPTAPLVF